MKQTTIKELITNYNHLRARLDKVNASINERADELAKFYIGKSIVVSEQGCSYYLYNVTNMEFDRDGVSITCDRGYKIWSKDIETGYDSYDTEYYIDTTSNHFRKIALYRYMCENKYLLCKTIFSEYSNEDLIETLINMTGIEELRSLPIVMRAQKFKTI